MNYTYYTRTKFYPQHYNQLKGFSSLEELFGSMDFTYFWKNDALSEDNNVGTLLSGYGLALISNFDMIYPILKTRLLNYRV